MGGGESKGGRISAGPGATWLMGLFSEAEVWLLTAPEVEGHRRN